MFKFKGKKFEILVTLGTVVLFGFFLGFYGLKIQSSHPYALWPVLDQGRHKPFDTWAREWMILASGRISFEGQSAVDFMLGCVRQVEECLKKPVFKFDESRVRKAIGLRDDQRWLSFEQIVNQPVILQLFQKIQEKRQRQENLDPLLQSVSRVYQAVNLLQAFLQGQIPFIYPRISEDKSITWVAPQDLTDLEWEPYRKWLLAYGKEDDQSEKARQDWMNRISPFVDMVRVRAELFYNQVRPFRIGWMLYFGALTLGIISLITHISILQALGLGLGLSGWAVHGLGMILRTFIMGRPPVTNMFESVIWVGWIAVLMAMILGRYYRYLWLNFVGFAVAGILLILADLGHMVLGESMHPLEPVLRNQFWLITHVLTITISYGCFALGYFVSLIGTGLLFWNKQKYVDLIRLLSLLNYRALQIGVVFLGAGIVLGGIWADYSWGRFWGWDPKETWSLIALLGYLALMHARIQGWLSITGLFVTSIMAFSLVVMAWYGVNYVLAAGLHSYGFGTGGLEVVLPLMIVSFLWSGFVAIYNRFKPFQV